MGMSVGGGGDGVKSEPNVVPMIDIMLVLLIIFMIVTPIISSGFQAEMPLARNVDLRQEEPTDIVLGVDQDGRFYVTDAFAVSEGDRQNIKPIGAGDLEEHLRRIYEQRTDRVLYFKADKGLEYGKIQDAVEIARRAGVRVLAAITEQQQDPGSRGLLIGGR